MTDEKKNWGGARAGGGRKKKYENGKTAYIPGWLADWIKDDPAALEKIERLKRSLDAD